MFTTVLSSRSVGYNKSASARMTCLLLICRGRTQRPQLP